jgi:hypothetical protein
MVKIYFIKMKISFFIFSKGWTKDSSKRMMLGFTNEPVYQLLLPASIDQTTALHIIVHIQDKFGCLTEFNLSSVNVFTNLSEFSNLIQDLNINEQSVTSISHVLNQINDRNMKILVESKSFSYK